MAVPAPGKKTPARTWSLIGGAVGLLLAVVLGYWIWTKGRGGEQLAGKDEKSKQLVPLATEAKMAVKQATTQNSKFYVNPKDGLTYVWIEAGVFRIGCSPGDNECFDGEKPAHQVTLSSDSGSGRRRSPRKPIRGLSE